MSERSLVYENWAHRPMRTSRSGDVASDQRHIPRTWSPRSMNRGQTATNGQFAQSGFLAAHHRRPISQVGLSSSPGRSG